MPAAQTAQNWWSPYEGMLEDYWADDGGDGGAGGQWAQRTSGGAQVVPLNQDFASGYAVDGTAARVGYNGQTWMEGGAGDSGGAGNVDPAFSEWLQAKNYAPVLFSANNAANRGLLDKATGKIVPGSIQSVGYADKNFGIASLIAAGVVTAGVASAAGAAGAGASAATGSSGIDAYLASGAVEGSTFGGAAAGGGAAGAVGAGTTAAELAAAGTAGATSSAGGVATVPGASEAAADQVINVIGKKAVETGALSQLAPAAAGVTAATLASGGAQPSTTEPSKQPTKTETGAKTVGGLSTGDWIQLAGLGASIWGSDKAQDSAEAYASQQAAMSKEMLDFAKQQWNEGAEFRTQAQQRALDVSDAQIAQMKQQDALAKEYADYNRTTFRPLEQGIVANAQNYDTPEKRAAAASTAMADVNSASAAAREAGARTMAANGVNPGSARAMAAQAGSEVQQAKAVAGAAYQARKGVETTGFARQMDAASLGRNLPSSQATSASLAINAGNSAVNTAAVPTTLQNQSTQAMTGAYQAAGSLNASAGSLYQRSADSANQMWSQLGATAGRIATSDENMKRDIEPADADEALAEVTSTPVSKFKYDPAAMASAGIEMPGDADAEYTGPMAQDANATMGEGAAPGGKKLDLLTMNGKTMLAIKAVNDKVDRMAGMMSSLAQRIGSGQLQAGMAA